MNEAKRKYKRKCKTRIVTFYIHEQELYEFSKSINFQKFIKDILQLLQTETPTSIMRRAYARKEAKKNGNL